MEKYRWNIAAYKSTKYCWFIFPFRQSFRANNGPNNKAAKTQSEAFIKNFKLVSRDTEPLASTEWANSNYEILVQKDKTLV